MYCMSPGVQSSCAQFLHKQHCSHISPEVLFEYGSVQTMQSHSSSDEARVEFDCGNPPPFLTFLLLLGTDIEDFAFFSLFSSRDFLTGLSVKIAVLRLRLFCDSFCNLRGGALPKGRMASGVTVTMPLSVFCRSCQHCSVYSRNKRTFASS